jgi:hypothetical protein
MKRLLFVIALLVSAVCQGQQKIPFATAAFPSANKFAYTNVGLWVDSVLRFPKYKQATSDSVLMAVDSSGVVYTITKTIIQNWANGATAPTDSSIFVTIYRWDTAKANIRNEIHDAWLFGNNHSDSLFLLHDGAWLSVTGDTVKTYTIYKSNGDAWLSADVRDNDNQTLSLSSDDTLSISGGNKVKLPYLRQYLTEPTFTSTGTTNTTYILPTTPNTGKHIQVFLNNALLYTPDYSISGNQITFNIPIESTDFLAIYFKSNP